MDIIKLKQSLKGYIVLSEYTEQVYNDLLNKKIPKSWQEISYQCLKPLGGWIIDFSERIEFIKIWILRSQLNNLLFPAFFNPHVIIFLNKKNNSNYQFYRLSF